jgi:hypothetical protein
MTEQIFPAYRCHAAGQRPLKVVVGDKRIMKQIKTLISDLTPMQKAWWVVSAPLILWALCLVTGVFVFGSLGFMSLPVAGIFGFVLTSRKHLGLQKTDSYPSPCITIRVISALYALPFIPFALFVVLRGLE